MIKKQIALIFIFIFIIKILTAQEAPFDKVYFTPNISIGYTFGGTFNIGLEIDLTTSLTSRPERLKRGGISVGHYWVLNTDFNPHRMTTFNIMYENESMDIKTGYGMMEYKWGRSNVNKWGQPAWAFDISFTNRDIVMPWLGIKSLLFSRSEWTWFDIPYISLYAKQKFYLNE